MVCNKNSISLLIKKINLFIRSDSCACTGQMQIIHIVRSTKDKLYLFIDKSTNMPYWDENKNIYIFSEKEFADEALDYFMQ